MITRTVRNLGESERIAAAAGYHLADPEISRNSEGGPRVTDRRKTVQSVMPCFAFCLEERDSSPPIERA
jgi:hypothetical protein